jgi:hypothetical protein
LLFKERLSARNKAETGIRYEWYALQRWAADYYKEFSKPKIVYPNMTSVFPFCYDESGCLCNQKCFIITRTDENLSLKSLVTLLNSKLCKLWIWYNCPELQGGTREISKVYFENFPIIADMKTKELEELADAQLLAHAQLQKHVSKFLNRAKNNLGLTKISEKLESFYKLEFKDFMAELKKQKIKLSLRDQDEWEEYFNGYRQNCTRLLLEIEENNRKIDQLVYGLYGLTEEEIAVIERGY